MPNSADWKAWNVLHRLRQTPELSEMLEKDDSAELSLQKRLRNEYPADLVRAALTLRDLRHRANRKFSRWAEMWFDRKGLEQSTSESVARHKASRFSGAGVDYCCGIGGDTLALAERGPVLGVDISAAACLYTRWNSEACGVESNVQVVCADLGDVLPRDVWMHIDPDRRPNAPRRTIRLQECNPDLESLHRLLRQFPGGAVKLSPASNFIGQFQDVEIELISLHGECKEATVWFGELAGVQPFRATVLPSGATIAGSLPMEWCGTSSLGRFVYDPDPAVVRSGLLDVTTQQLGLERLDLSDEYLTSDALVDSPFVTPFEVLAVLSPNHSRLRRHLRAEGIGSLEIKCRRIPVSVELLRRQLALRGNQPGTLIMARVSGKTQAILCRRINTTQK